MGNKVMDTQQTRTPLSSTFDGIILVNVVQVESGKQDDALEVLRITVKYVAENYPGFRWSRLLKSTDGKTVINQAAWRSQEEFEALFTDEEFLKRYGRLGETGTWEYHTYEVSDLILPIT